MTLVPDVAMPWTTILLDTVGPKLQLAAVTIVAPPDDIVITVTADEALGYLNATFIDSKGRDYPVGYEWRSDTEVRMSIPSVGMSTGGGRLHLDAADTVGNLNALDWALLVQRPRVYDLHGWTEAPFEVGVFQDSVIEATAQTESVFAVEIWHEEE